MHLIVNIEGKEPKKVDVSSETFTVGRSSKNTIQIKSDSVSRSHLRIRSSNNVIYVTDLGSANGTYIDNEMLTPNIETPWHTFFPINFGGKVTLAFDATLQGIDLEKKVSKRSIIKERKKIRNSTNINISLKKKIESKKKPSKHLFIGLSLIFGLASFIAYSYKSGNSEEAHPLTRPPKPSLVVAQNVANNIVKIPTDLIDWDKCQNEKEIFFCSLIKPNLEYSEGVIQKDNDILIYYNFGKRISNSEIEPTFSFANDYHRITFLMANLAFKEDIRLAIEKLDFNNLMVVDISLSPKKINRVMKISKSNLLKLPLADIQKIFSGLVNKDPKLFNSLILPLVEMGSKLPY